MTRRVTLSERQELLKRYSNDEPPEDVLARFESTGRLPQDKDEEFDKATPKPTARKWFPRQDLLPLIGTIAWGFYVTVLAVGLTVYVWQSGDGGELLRRVALGIEAFVVIAAITVGLESLRLHRLFSVRRGLRLGAIFFVGAAVIVPLGYSFAASFGAGVASGDVTQMVAGLGFLILGSTIALVCINHYWRAVTEPDDKRPLNLLALWFRRSDRPRAQVRPFPPEQQRAESGIIDIDFRSVREWRLPHMPNLLTGGDRRHCALIMMGRCAAAMVLIYLLGVRFGYVRDDGSAPAGMTEAYYGVIATVIAFGIGILYFAGQSKGRFDGRLLRRAAAQIVLAFAFFEVGQQVIQNVAGLPSYADIVVQYGAFFIFVSGCAKFVRLPWSFWK